MADPPSIARGGRIAPQSPRQSTSGMPYLKPRRAQKVRSRGCEFLSTEMACARHIPPRPWPYAGNLLFFGGPPHTATSQKCIKYRYPRPKAALDNHEKICRKEAGKLANIGSSTGSGDIGASPSNPANGRTPSIAMNCHGIPRATANCSAKHGRGDRYSVLGLWYKRGFSCPAALPRTPVCR